MRRRICLVGAALSVTSLAFAGATATAASSKKTTKVACSANISIMIAAGDDGVSPPAAQGTEYGTANCNKGFRSGVQKDSFTVPDSGDTVANFWLYFPTGAIHGSYDLVPQEGTLNFLETDWLGTMKVLGGTGAYKGVKGTGTMTCKTLDGIHTKCSDKLKLKLS